jgi:hypothetical protein
MANVQNMGSGDAEGKAARMSCMKRVEQAINRHDLDALADCFEPDYQSEFPAHLNRAFRGHPSMRKNWSQIFASVPDVHATLVRAVADGETVWTEWDWKGTRVDGEVFHHRGVTIQTVPHDRITRTWLYIEPVRSDGPDPGSVLRDALREK